MSATRPFHVGGEEGPADTVYLGVFRRTALDRVGGYDEDFVRAQDWEMNYRIRTTGGTVWFSPKLSVSYRPRSSLSALASSTSTTGGGAARSCVLIRDRSTSVISRRRSHCWACLQGLFFQRLSRCWTLTVPLGYLAVVVGGSVYVGRGLGLRARLVLPVVLVTMHMSWGAGFLSSWRPDRAVIGLLRTQLRQPGLAAEIE